LDACQGPVTPAGSELGDAIEAIMLAARAWVLRFGPASTTAWQRAVWLTGVETALQKAESLGGTRRMGPEGTRGTLVIGQFTDPEGHLIGVAGTA